MGVDTVDMMVTETHQETRSAVGTVSQGFQESSTNCVIQFMVEGGF